MQIDWLEILKWAGIVFAAGFVGYFGKYLSKMVIAKLQRQKPKQTAPPPVNLASHVIPPQAVEKADAKLEKKKAKAGAKRTKKENK